MEETSNKAVQPAESVDVPESNSAVRQTSAVRQQSSNYAIEEDNPFALSEGGFHFASAESIDFDSGATNTSEKEMDALKINGLADYLEANNAYSEADLAGLSIGQAMGGNGPSMAGDAGMGGNHAIGTPESLGFSDVLC